MTINQENDVTQQQIDSMLTSPDNDPSYLEAAHAAFQDMSEEFAKDGKELYKPDLNLS